MRDFSFEFDQPISSGRIVAEVRNEGRFPHEFVLVVLPNELTLSIDEQLRSTTPVALATLVALPSIPPGDQKSVAFDLIPGRYAVISFERQADGTPDYLHGMSAEFDVSVE